jgi:hypothetical protein
MALKMWRRASRWPTGTPILSSVTSLEKLRNVWNRHSWSVASGKATLKTLRSHMSLSVTITSVRG